MDYREHYVIVGFGWVGQANAIALKKLGFDVSYFDPGAPDRHYPAYNDVYDSLEKLSNVKAKDSPSTWYIVCVGDRVSEEGVQDISLIKQALESLKGVEGGVILRSTILPEHLENLEFDFYMPEFLHEKKAVEECIEPYLFVVGWQTEKAEPSFFDLWRKSARKSFSSSPREASFIKYLSNLWNATRIAFVNEFGDAIGRPKDKEELQQIERVVDFLFDGKNYLRYGRAFGGHCLPKDTRAFVGAHNKGFSRTPLLAGVYESNSLHAKLQEQFPLMPEWYSEWPNQHISGWVALSELWYAIRKNLNPVRFFVGGEETESPTKVARVLITGGAGFVGYHLAKRLSDQGYDVTIADNFFRGKRDEDLEALLEKPNVKMIECDLSVRDSWIGLGGGYDQVYHLVGINGTKLFYEIPHEVLRIGVASTMHALDWFRNENGVKDAKILYTSSNEAYASALEAYGTLPLPTVENVPLVIADTYNPRWSYGGQKLIGELFFIHYAKAYDFRMSIVRPHNFYGPRSGYEHVIPGTLAKIQSKTDPFPLPGADETRSFCYIDDAVEAMQAVMESKATDGGTYHIGNPHEITMEALVEEVFKAADWHPMRVEKKESPQGSVKRRLPDVSKIKRDTGWEAKTPLSKGLEKTIQWYHAHPKE